MLRGPQAGAAAGAGSGGNGQEGAEAAQLAGSGGESREGGGTGTTAQEGWRRPAIEGAGAEEGRALVLGDEVGEQGGMQGRAGPRADQQAHQEQQQQQQQQQSLLRQPVEGARSCQQDDASQDEQLLRVSPSQPGWQPQGRLPWEGFMQQPLEPRSQEPLLQTQVVQPAEPSQPQGSTGSQEKKGGQQLVAVGQATQLMMVESAPGFQTQE